jgi:hypothetical protein
MLLYRQNRDLVGAVKGFWGRGRLGYLVGSVLGAAAATWGAAATSRGGGPARAARNRRPGSDPTPFSQADPGATLPRDPTPKSDPTPTTQRPRPNAHEKTWEYRLTCYARAVELDAAVITMYCDFCPRRLAAALSRPNAHDPTPKGDPTPSTQRPRKNVGISTNLLCESCRTR